MHIQDGFLPLTIAIPAFIITIICWVISFKKVKLTEQQVPMMGLLTALFFAAMFMDFPVMGGTTAHLLGGAAIGLILGPFAGLISMSIILVLQAFLFGDGGLIVLGANVLNMGVIGVFIPCIIFIVLTKLFKPKLGGGLYEIGNPAGVWRFRWKFKPVLGGLYGIIFVSAFFGALLPAVAAGAEIGLSSLFLYNFNATVSAMVVYHFVIGIAEGFVTVLLIATLIELRPDVIEKSPILGKLSLFKDKTKNEETENVKK